jgi:hypothetical protein
MKLADSRMVAHIWRNGETSGMDIAVSNGKINYFMQNSLASLDILKIPTERENMPHGRWNLCGDTVKLKRD